MLQCRRAQNHRQRGSGVTENEGARGRGVKLEKVRDEHLTAEGGLLGPGTGSSPGAEAPPRVTGDCPPARRHLTVYPESHRARRPRPPAPTCPLPTAPGADPTLRPPAVRAARPSPPGADPARRPPPALSARPAPCRPRPPTPPVRAPSCSSFPRIPPVHIGGPLSPASPEPMLKTPWSRASGHSSPADSTCPDTSSRSSQERPAATEGL